MQHKTEILLDILRSGAQLDNKIKEHIEDIDTTLLTLLHRRIEVSKQINEGEEMINGLTSLFWRCVVVVVVVFGCSTFTSQYCITWLRLKAAAEEHQATPSLRLLHQALQALDPTDQQEDAADTVSRIRAVETLLARAFTGQGSRADILSIAAAVARGGGFDDLEQDSQGFVPQAVFLKDTSDLVLEVEGRLEALEQRLDTYALTVSVLVCGASS